MMQVHHSKNEATESGNMTDDATMAVGISLVFVRDASYRTPHEACIPMDGKRVDAASVH